MDNLTQDQYNALLWLYLRVMWMQENSPDSFGDIIAPSSGDVIDVADLDSKRAMYYLLESMEADLEATSLEIAEIGIPKENEAIVSEIAMAQLSAFNSVCNDFFSNNYGDALPCTYDDAIYPGSWESGGTWTIPEETNWWQSAGNFLLDTANSIGWDNIFNWATGDDDTPTGGGTGGCQPGKVYCAKNGTAGCYFLHECDTPPEDDEETDWGKIALWGGIALIVVIGIVVIVKSRR